MTKYFGFFQKILETDITDSVLRLKNPRGTTIIGYADDVAIVVVAKKLHDMETSMVLNVRTWLQKASLELAAHKTESVVISSRKKVGSIKIRIR